MRPAASSLHRWQNFPKPTWLHSLNFCFWRRRLWVMIFPYRTGAILLSGPGCQINANCVEAGMRTLLGLAAVLLAQGRPSLPESLSSKHYELKTSCTREQGQELLDFMELVHKTYLDLLKPDNKEEVEKRRFTLLLYKDATEYARAGAPPGSGAFYNGKELVGWYDLVFMKPFFAHEGMHQFTDATSASFRDFPMWFTEGIADCIGNGEVRSGKLYMCVKSGTISRMRLQLVQAAVKQGAAYPLGRLLTLSRMEFMQNADLCYAQAWSFCHFLMAYPKEED